MVRKTLIKIFMLAEWHRELKKSVPECVDLMIDCGVTILPCKMGDAVWGISSYNHCGKHVKKGIVHEMFYGEDMKLCIAVKGVCRGVWGEKVFGTEEEALRALEVR